MTTKKPVPKEEVIMEHVIMAPSQKKRGKEPFILNQWDDLEVNKNNIVLTMKRIETKLTAYKAGKMEFSSKKGLKAFEYALLIIEAEEARCHYFPPKLPKKIESAKKKPQPKRKNHGLKVH